eukprot:COSAG06_NODE_18643_length_876_cov_0.895753_1_plen_286_part_10
MERERQEAQAELRAKQQQGQDVLKREWGHVELTNEVASVFLKKTQDAATAERTAVEAEAAAATQMAIAMEMQQKIQTEIEEQTQAALHLHSQAGKAKQEAEAEKREAEESSRRVVELEAEVVELRVEVARLQGVAEEAERRTRLAERVLDAHDSQVQQPQIQQPAGGGSSWSNHPPAALAPSTSIAAAKEPRSLSSGPDGQGEATTAAHSVAQPPSVQLQTPTPQAEKEAEPEDPWAALAALATRVPVSKFASDPASPLQLRPKPEPEPEPEPEPAAAVVVEAGEL